MENMRGVFERPGQSVTGIVGAEALFEDDLLTSMNRPRSSGRSLRSVVLLVFEHPLGFGLLYPYKPRLRGVRLRSCLPCQTSRLFFKGN